MVQFRRGRKSPWRVQIRNSSGEFVTRSFSRKEDAERFESTEKRKRQLMRAGLEAPRDQILLLDYSKTFLARRFGGAVALPTAEQDESRLRNYWLEKLGLRPLATITSAEIKSELDHIQFELKHSPADRNRHRALMHTLFADAMRDDKVVFNPVAKIPLVEEKAERKSGTLEPDDQAKYVQAVYRQGAQYGMLADLMLWTGARIMAAAAIQYRDIDFESSAVRIRRLVERASKTVVERTKGGGSGGAELVPLFPLLKDRVLAHRRASEFTRPSDFIAAGPTGGYVPYESYRDAHAHALTETGIERFTPHALRKAFATNAKRAGYTRADIREMLGHSSEAMTARYDLEDIEHLIEKGKRLGFGNSVTQVSPKQGSAPRTKGGRRG